MRTALPSADTAAMLFWALLASGPINMRKVDGWQTLAIKPIDQPIDLAARWAPPAALNQYGAGTTWIFAIMPPSSCSRMWQ
jgi:hypothetical protein